MYSNITDSQSSKSTFPCLMENGKYIILVTEKTNGCLTGTVVHLKHSDSLYLLGSHRTDWIAGVFSPFVGKLELGN